jgi:sigma-B regulation protein RsbU (phosphoserine phosphatase)
VIKSSIRFKFFAVLLIFSLAPLFLSRTITGRAARTMTGSLTEKTRTELLAIVTAELQHNAMSILRMVEGRGQALRIGTHLLAQEAEQIMAGPPPDASVRLPAIEPPVMDHVMHMARYGRQTRNGRLKPLNVSFESPSFTLSPGTSSAEVRDQMLRLQALQPLFASLYSELDTSVIWAQVGLESGLLVTYPGHGSFPMMYDHRTQPWYVDTRKKERPVWTTPLLDPATKQMVSAVSYPFHNPDGTFAGVASLSVPIQSILYETELKSRWSDDILSFMVSRTPDAGLRILAQQSYEEAGERRHHWMADVEAEYMTSDDPEEFARLLAAMATSDSGTMRLSFEGEDSVWAYASNDNFSFLLIVPESVVARLPDEVSGSVGTLLEKVRTVAAIISAAMLLITALFAWFGSRTFTRSLIAMTEAARRLANGDFSTRITHRTGDERDILAAAFNDMVPRLEEHMHLSHDLELAEGVQRMLLPGAVPALSGYDIAGDIAYCDQTGGDYYDFLSVRGEDGPALGVILGDVSGHGIPAALIMASVRGQLHSLTDFPMTPGRRITAVNARIAHDLDGTGRFLTLFYLELTPGSGTVRWVRAGHDPAFRYSPETDTFGELKGEGLPIGVLEETAYDDYETALAPGEVLIVATDGVWEARDAGGQMFGKERILALVRENAHKSAEGIRVEIMEAVANYQANGQEDDIAVVVIKRL